MGEEAGDGFVGQLRAGLTRMSRIDLTPEWVGLLDFETRFHHWLEEAMARAPKALADHCGGGRRGRDSGHAPPEEDGQRIVTMLLPGDGQVGEQGQCLVALDAYTLTVALDARRAG
jgi:hypothetical protein